MRDLLTGFWLLLCLLASGTALAQTPATGDADADSALKQLRAQGQPLSETAIRDLVSRLDDVQVRGLLLEHLDAVASRGKAQAPEGLSGLLLNAHAVSEQVRNGLAASLAAAPRVPAALGQAMDRLRDGRPASVLLLIALGFVLMLAAGAAAEWGIRRGLRHFLRQRHGPGAGQTAAGGRLAISLFVDLIALAAFVIVALLVFFALTQGNPVTRSVVMTYLGAIVAVRGFAIFSRFLMAPQRPDLRLLRLSDADARFLHRRDVVIAAIAAFGFLTVSLLRRLGMPVEEARLLSFSVGLVLVGVVVDTIARSRHAIAADLAWDARSSGQWRLFVAEAWPLVTIVFVVFLYLFSVILTLTGGGASYPVGLATLLIVVFLPHVDAVMERRARRLESRRETGEHLAGQARIVALRAARILMVVGAVLFLVQAWGVNLFDLARDSVGGRIGAALVDIGLTVLVAFVLWEMARIAIERRLAAEGPAGEAAAASPGEQGGQGASRIRTLLPLLRVAIQITIVAMTVMVVLSALGVDIGPLLAGAGVVGLAVGFGAQTLVRDIVSGVFFLLDDAFRLGEYIDVGVVKGTVEKISLRSLRLRHHRGALHTVPFGEIEHLTNYSRDWAIMKLEFRVPFDTDLDKVRKIFKKIGQDLMADPEMGPDFLEPFKSQGVLQTDDSAFVVRGKFMAKPGRQFLIRRAVFQAVQKAFAEEGIHFADRRVTVYVPGAEHLDPEARAAAGRAAASAVAGSGAGTSKS